MRTVLLLTLLVAAHAAPASARVQDMGVYQGGAAAARYNYQRFGTTGYMKDGDVRNACVMLCRRDTNPCDPPEFKRADGRCNDLFN